LKYLIDEAAAERIRRDLQPFCRSDTHNPIRRHGSDPRGYDVTSLYLDTPGLAFYHAKERGDAERTKLRVRTYGDHPFAVLECKRRVADVIDKTRASVDRKDVHQASLGLVDPGPDHLELRRFHEDFALQVARSGAAPVLLLRYEREAFVSEVDHYARVTFDRCIEAGRTDAWSFDEPAAGYTRFDAHWLREEAQRNVVLELKCQSSIPWWMTDLIRSHALKRQSLSKYSIGIHLTGLGLGEDRIARRSARWMQ
jgi:SPX domain protein involved in polyphosphate accumulation